MILTMGNGDGVYIGVNINNFSGIIRNTNKHASSLKHSSHGCKYEILTILSNYVFGTWDSTTVNSTEYNNDLQTISAALQHFLG